MAKHNSHTERARIFLKDRNPNSKSKQEQTGRETERKNEVLEGNGGAKEKDDSRGRGIELQAYMLLLFSLILK